MKLDYSLNFFSKVINFSGFLYVTYSLVGDPKFGWRRTDLWAGITLPRFKEADFDRDL